MSITNEQHAAIARVSRVLANEGAGAESARNELLEAFDEPTPLHNPDALYCLRCKRDLTDVPRNEMMLRWECPSCYPNGGVSTQYAAAHWLGPYAPPRREPPSIEDEIPGFMRIGPTTYKRISDPPSVPAQWMNRTAPELISWRWLAFVGIVLLLAMVCR